MSILDNYTKRIELDEWVISHNLKDDIYYLYNKLDNEGMHFKSREKLLLVCGWSGIDTTLIKF